MPSTPHFAFGNIRKGHISSYANSEGIAMYEPDLKYHGEEGPTVEPEEGLLRRDQAVDYPRSIIDAVSIFGIGWVCVVQTSVYAGTVDSHLRAWPSVQVVRPTAAMEVG